MTNETGTESPTPPANTTRKPKGFPYFKIALVVSLIAIYLAIAIMGRSRDLQTLQSVHQEFLTLQQTGASQQAWDTFKQSTHTKIDPIIQKLEETVRRDQPYQQHLLWASRDYLYPMLDNARTEKSPDQVKFETHLTEAEAGIYNFTFWKF